MRARNTGTGLTKEVVTTATGRYTLPFLTIGTYELRFSLAGFQPHLISGLELHVNDRLTVNATLNVSRKETTIEVSAAAHTIQATPAVQTLMGPTQVQELPLNNRNFVQLATLVPGVSSSLPDEVGIGLTNLVSISIAGARVDFTCIFTLHSYNLLDGSGIGLERSVSCASISSANRKVSRAASEP